MIVYRCKRCGNILMVVIKDRKRYDQGHVYVALLWDGTWIVRNHWTHELHPYPYIARCPFCGKRIEPPCSNNMISIKLQKEGDVDSIMRELAEEGVDTDSLLQRIYGGHARG